MASPLAFREMHGSTTKRAKVGLVSSAAVMLLRSVSTCSPTGRLAQLLTLARNAPLQPTPPSARQEPPVQQRVQYAHGAQSHMKQRNASCIPSCPLLPDPAASAPRTNAPCAPFAAKRYSMCCHTPRHSHRHWRPPSPSAGACERSAAREKTCNLHASGRLNGTFSRAPTLLACCQSADA